MIHDLAGGKSQTAIAAMYGVTQQSISEFAQKHAEEIAELKANTRELLADLWIADKNLRIAAYQQNADTTRELLAQIGTGERNGERPSELLRTEQAALKSVAEEMGDLPQRIKVEGEGVVVHHKLEGVNTDDLA